jgi:transcriptional accessory protein Tex/SPT6
MQPTSMPKAAPGAEHLDLSRIAQDLQIRKLQVEAVVGLLDEGNTVPFITRYRKERTGGLNEDVIRAVQARVQAQRQLAERKQTILKSIENQGKLTDELRAAILAAESPKRLEDLYLPYKPKKRTLATTARERGLEPLAQAVWNRDPVAANLAEVTASLVNPEKELNTPEDVLAGVGHVLAEHIAETAEVRAAVRDVLWDSGKIGTTKSEKLHEGQGREYKSYFQFTEAVKHIPPHRILAINRGEKENALAVKVDFDQAGVQKAALDRLPLADHPHADFLRTVTGDALTRLLLPSLEREIRKELTMRAEAHAVSVFARNLRSLLLAPPLRGRRVLAIDPGFRTGCKVAALDEHGNLLEEGVIFPHPPQNRKGEARTRLEELVRKHQAPVVAIGNGTACRETEEVVSELIADIEKRRAEGTLSMPLAAPAAAPVTPAQVPAPSAPPVESVSAPADHSVLSTQYSVLSTPPAEAVPAPVEHAIPTATVEAPAAVAPYSVLSTPPVVEALPAPPPAPLPPPSSLPEPPADLAYVIVNEAGASVYSASAVGREEFPEYDATTRGTISIGRRLQDPLSELVKIDPQNVGVGLYQHDVSARQLKESLEAVVESCVNQVGIDLNTASVPLLRHVSGMNQLVAREVVEHRKQNGPFRSREQLMHVAGVGPARYVQAAGFLKIPGGGEPLDITWIHPESYPAARQLLGELGYGPDVLTDRDRLGELRDKLKRLAPEEVAARLQVGVPTVKDIIEALARPGRDPREDLPPPVFKKGILKLEDLQPGMELKGTVLNVVDFGAFVDIGLKDTGLVHISQMANRYVKSPYDVVSVGDIVTVWVIAVDPQDHRVSLTMIRPGTERKPPERGAREGREGPPPQRREGRREGGGPPRGRRPGGPPPQRRGGPPPQQQPQPAAAGEAVAATATPPPPRQHGRGGPHHGGRGRGGPPPQAVPRKPARPVPKPKLSQDQLKGAADLRTFSELAAFLEAKQKHDEPRAEEPAPAAAPAEAPAVEQTPPAPPA